MKTLRRGLVIAFALLIAFAGVLSAHDMFLRPGRHFVAENSTMTVRLLSGTFSLEEDGLPDELAARRREGRLNEASRERYHKHVKALIQVGAKTSATSSTVLGYPAEIVPLQNPYDLKVGASLDVRVLVNGNPVGNQYVQYGGRTASEARVPPKSVRSNAEGIARIPLNRTGTYFIKFIYMDRPKGDAEANYESRWTTLTFGVR